MSPLMAASLKRHKADRRAWPSRAAVFLPNGRPPEVGEVFRQTDLAASLQYMADEERAAASRGREAGLEAAPHAFYRRDISRNNVPFIKQEGGLLAAPDLAEYPAPPRPRPPGSAAPRRTRAGRSPLPREPRRSQPGARSLLRLRRRPPRQPVLGNAERRLVRFSGRARYRADPVEPRIAIAARPAPSRRGRPRQATAPDAKPCARDKGAGPIPAPWYACQRRLRNRLVKPPFTRALSPQAVRERGEGALGGDFTSRPCGWRGASPAAWRAREPGPAGSSWSSAAMSNPTRRHPSDSGDCSATGCGSPCGGCGAGG